MLSTDEKKLLTFIKYAPILFVLITSLLMTLLLIKNIEEESIHEINKITELYVNPRNQIIKEKVIALYKYIQYKEKNAINDLKNNLKEKVYAAHTMATKIYLNNKDTKSKNEIINLIKYYLKDIRFNDGRGYIFIDDIDGNKILQPLNKELENKNLLNFSDINGYKFVETITKTIKDKSERFDEYYWYKNSDTSKTYKKIGFYKYFEAYDFAIGTGEYIDDFKKNLKKETLIFINALENLDNEYIFILDYEGDIISHGNQEYIGKNVFSLKENYDFKFLEEFIAKSDKSDSFVQYSFPFESKDYKEKTSFIKRLDSWSWFIGTGYDNAILDKEINKEKKAFIKIKEDRYIEILSISLLLTFLLMLLSLYISKILERKFTNYKKMIKEKEKDNLEEIIKIAKIYEELFELNKSKIILVNPENGDILNANKSAIEFYGYPRSKLLSMNISDINILSKEEINIEIKNIMNSNKEYFNFVHELSNGERRDVRVQSSLSVYNTMPALFSTIQDVTKENEIKNELIKTEQEFKSLFEFSNLGLSIRDLNGNFTKVNKKLIEMFDYNEVELLNKTCTDISSPNTQNEEMILFKKLIDKEINDYNIEKEYIRKDGTKFEAVLSMASFNNKDGELLYILSSIIDISEMRKKDNLLFQQSKMASMGEMIGNIAHQWRQPLSIISTISSGVKLRKEFDKLDDAILLESMDDINNSVNHLSNTIDDFRNFFKPDKSKSRFLITDVIEKALKLISFKLKSEQIELVLDFFTVEIKSLENELIQVIMNILNNSIDALKNTKNSKLIFIKTMKIENDLVIKFSDNAGGIDKDKVNRVFEPYFTTKDKSQGTGIGLYMTEEIITKHMHGSITATNLNFVHNDIECFGAEFKIILPIDKREN